MIVRALVAVSCLAVIAIAGFAGAGCRSADKSPTTDDPPAAAQVTKPQVTPLQAERASIREQLAIARDRQVQRLQAYRKAGRFPRNHLTLDTIPVFVDRDDTACAVGHLMREDGERDAVATIQRENNHIRVTEVTSGPLISWLLNSGLIQEEAALIQPGYTRSMIVKAALRREKSRLHRHFRAVIDQLKKDREASLDIAVERLLCSRSVAGADCTGRGAPPVFADDDGWQDTAITGVTGAVALALGDQHGCARDAAGAVTCFDSGERVQKINTTPARALAAAGAHTCAVGVDGRVTCWGMLGFGDPHGTYNGRHDDATNAFDKPVPADAPLAVTGVRDAVDVALSDEVGCALTKMGRVHCWGTERKAPMRARAIARLSKASHVAIGMASACAVDTKGQVHCWRLTAGAMRAAPLQISERTCETAGDKRTCTERDRGPLQNIARVALREDVFEYDEGVVVTRSGEVKSLYWEPSRAHPKKHKKKGDDGDVVTTFAARVDNIDMPIAATELAFADTGCARAQDGTTHCWGGPFGPHARRAPFTPTVDVAVAGSRLCYIAVDQSVHCTRWRGYPPLRDIDP